MSIKNWYCFAFLTLLSCCTSKVEYIKPISPDCGNIEKNGDLLECYIKYKQALEK